jgi:hypothetical protein
VPNLNNQIGFASGPYNTGFPVTVRTEMDGKRVNSIGLSEMTTFTNYIYSKSAASRILEKKVISITVERDRVRCQLWDKTFRTLSTARFKRHFAEHRKEQGQWLTAYRCGDEYHVTDYVVKVHADHLVCNCKDWLIQKSIGIKRPCCKHCYSVLSKLNCNSLAEYVEKNSEARSTGEKATNHKPEDSHQTSSSLAPKLPQINRWKWQWETYARDRAGNPLQTANTYSNRYPTQKEILENRKLNHSKGFRLVAIEQETPVTA